MQILRLLAARRVGAATSAERHDAGEDDKGSFFDLDFSSVRASSFGSSGSDSDSDESCAELDFIISLQRSHSASAPLKLCPSEPPTRANSLQSQRHADRKRGITLRSLSFGARKPAPLYRSPSFARSSSSSRLSFARSSTSSAQSLPLFMDSHHGQSKRVPSRDVIRRCLTNISRRIRTVASPRATDARGPRRLRKCRSASSAPPASRRDDGSQDGIAGAIAHCKESLHRGADFCPADSVSECDSALLRSSSE